MFLPPLPISDTAQCIGSFFAQEGRHIDPQVSDALVAAARQYPFYVQRLASEVYERSGRDVTMEDVELAKMSVIQSETGLYETMIAPLTTRQLRLLKTLSATPSAQLTSAEFVAKAELPASSIADIREILLREDMIETTEEGVWRVVDPFFSEWLNRL